MSEGKRPGGLTALAVLNFVFGGMGVLGVLALVAVFAFMGAVGASAEGEEAQRAMAEAWEALGKSWLLVFIAVSVATSVLMVVSGVGYLQQRRFLGRTLGNVYALLSVASSVVVALMVPGDAGGGFNIGTLVNLVYPGLTLFLLNTTFKEDFVH